RRCRAGRRTRPRRRRRRVPGDQSRTRELGRQMSASGGTRAIIAAFLANLGIAITKLIAYFLTRSSSMLAESIHSLADSGNQLLLIFGGRRARRPADAEHPFGYGRERYVY